MVSATPPGPDVVLPLEPFQSHPITTIGKLPASCRDEYGKSQNCGCQTIQQPPLASRAMRHHHMPAAEYAPNKTADKTGVK
jgi:hypothetical protein